MTSPVPSNTSRSARLIVDAPGYVIGWQETVIVPSPVAGAVWSYKTDGRYWERLVSVRHTLTTSAVVANRFPTLQLKDVNGRVILSIWAGGTVTAGKTLGLNLQRENALQGDYGGVETYGPLPDLLVEGGWTWTPLVTNMDVGDTLTGITLIVQRFPNDITRIDAE